MFIIYNTIEDGARGVEQYFSFQDSLVQAQENFTEADSFLQYGETLHLVELKNINKESLTEDHINLILKGEINSVGENKIIKESDYSFSEDTTESYSR